MSNLEKCLKDLERIRRKSLRELAKNCKSEYMRNSAAREIRINYASAKNWIIAVYRTGYQEKIDLSKIEPCNETGGLAHLAYHLNQIRMLGRRIRQ
jgi:hypothetical protein